MNLFNPQAVQVYIAKRDRKSPLFFTGRREEQVIAQDVLENLLRQETKGNTVIFQGAPGAGKTALLDHLRSRFRAQCDTARLPASLVHRPDEALYQVFKQIEPKQAKKLKESHQTTAEGGVNIGIASGGVSSSSTQSPLSISTIDQLMDLRKGVDRPLMLFLDEAQNANGDLPDGKSSILQQLHEGGAGNVSLIAGGLSDTETRLSSLGISRPSSDNVRTLQPLSGREVMEALEAFLHSEDFGIDREGCDRDALRQVIVNESMGWPQHLTNALRSLGEELIGAEGRLAECDLDRVQQRSQARREEYYRGRIETIPDTLLYEVTTAVPKGSGVNKYQVYEAVERAYKKHPLSNMELPYENAFHTLVHVGVLQDDGTGKLTVPIPSMHDYIKNRTRSFD